MLEVKCPAQNPGGADTDKDVNAAGFRLPRLLGLSCGYPALSRWFSWMCLGDVSVAVLCSLCPLRLSGALLGLASGCPGNVLGLSWECPGAVLGMSWGCPGAAMGLSCALLVFWDPG